MPCCELPPADRAYARAAAFLIADGVLPSQSSDTLRVNAAVFTRGSERQVVLANMTSRTQLARVSARTIELAPYEVRFL